ncbi:unnamed protein product [Linum trigynum]|uniref:ATP synthase F0 subunit 8 n=1 Tax=Linum trigynum TaxID=586398 RepID=A0AAV2FCH0_9ROSI
METFTILLALSICLLCGLYWFVCLLGFANRRASMPPSSPVARSQPRKSMTSTSSTGPSSAPHPRSKPPRKSPTL